MGGGSHPENEREIISAISHWLFDVECANWNLNSREVPFEEMRHFGTGGAESCGLLGSRLLYEETVTDVLSNGFHQERRGTIPNASPFVTVASHEPKFLSI
jgi:hypothetical protein